MKQSSKLLIIFGLGIILIYFINKYNEGVRSNIMENKYETIAKVYEVEYKLKKRWALYKYKFNGNTYKSRTTDYFPYLSSFELLNKYFVVVINTKDPDRNILYLDREVTDSIAIAKSGL